MLPDLFQSTARGKHPQKKTTKQRSIGQKIEQTYLRKLTVGNPRKMEMAPSLETSSVWELQLSPRAVYIGP